MSRLVRARVKPVEMLPEWAKCCWIDGNHDYEFTVDLSSRRTLPMVCFGCMKPFNRNEIGVLATSGRRAGSYVTLFTLDLDEGPYQEPTLNFPGQQKGANQQ